MRPSWDEIWMHCAETLAMRSLCDGAKVGAVIVSAGNWAMWGAYNGPAPGLNFTDTCQHWCPYFHSGLRGTGNYSTCLASHAEANAIARSDWSQRQGGTIYVSGSMCINCARQVASSGLARVVHTVRGDDDERRNPAQVEEYLCEAGLDVARMMEQAEG